MIDRETVKRIEAALLNASIESASFEARQMAKEIELGNLTEVEMLKRRLSGEPLQYILGEWEFFGLPFLVGPGVLIPRADTEIAVEQALGLLKNKPNARVLDICAGSGCIGIAIAKNTDAIVSFLEKSEDAIEYLKKNLELNGVNAKIYNADALKEPPLDDRFDLIISNPPYIKTADLSSLQKEVQFEPSMALDGGEDGLVFYREIAKNYKPLIASGGSLVFEIGFDEADDVSEILEKEGYKDIKTVRDYGKNQRVVIGTVE